MNEEHVDTQKIRINNLYMAYIFYKNSRYLSKTHKRSEYILKRLKEEIKSYNMYMKPQPFYYKLQTDIAKIELYFDLNGIEFEHEVSIF